MQVFSPNITDIVGAGDWAGNNSLVVGTGGVEMFLLQADNKSTSMSRWSTHFVFICTKLGELFNSSSYVKCMFTTPDEKICFQTLGYRVCHSLWLSRGQTLTGAVYTA